MFATHLLTTPILTECPDRRAHPRLEHRDTVELDGCALVGRDISARGLSVIVPPPVKVGDTVRVRLAACADSGESVMANARVARVAGSPEGFVVGLEFIE